MSEQAVERSSVGLDQLVIGSPVVGTQADSLEFGAQRCMGDLPMGLESDGSKTTVDGQHRWELASADIYRRLRVKHFPAIVLSRIESPNALLCIVEERKETRVGELMLQIVLLHVRKIDLRDEGLRHAPVLRPASRRGQVGFPPSLVWTVSNAASAIPCGKSRMLGRVSSANRSAWRPSPAPFSRAWIVGSESPIHR